MITRHQIETAHALIGPFIRRTPVISIEAGTFAACPVLLKLELLQHTGSFKPRGAFANLLRGEVPDAGVAAASGGNHGAAVAFAAAALGHPARIFVPSISSPVKIDRIRSYGAEVTVGGDEYADALAACSAFCASSGAMSVHAYDATETLEGQGTIGREIDQQTEDLDTLLVAVGGGGLIGGIASWFTRRVKIVAVESEGTAALARAREAGRPVDVDVYGLAADSLGARSIGGLAFEAASLHVNASLVVSDSDIRNAQCSLWEHTRLIAEPGGATALAALTSGAYRPSPDERVAVLVCGGNTSPQDAIAAVE